MIKSSSPALQHKINNALGILAMYATKGATFRSFTSGGKDSAVATHLASFHPQFAGVAHVRTKTGPASERHSDEVKRVSREAGWHYLEQYPAWTLPQLVARDGLPGPAAHRYMYRYLKERPFLQLVQTARGNAKRLIAVSGIRAAESAARSKVVTEYTAINNKFWWVNPIWDWSDSEVRAYVDEFELIVPNMQHSLDCYCGAYATQDERELIRLTDAWQFEYLEALEAIAYQARAIQLIEAKSGNRKQKDVIPEAFCRWGHGLNKTTRMPKEPVTNMPEICNTCAGHLNAAGNVGTDPDVMMQVAQLARKGGAS